MPAEVAIDELAASVPVGAPAAPWARLFSPSLSDLFFLFITAWLFLVSPLGWQRLLLDADTALHTRIGQYILSTGTVPHQDLFAFSKTPSAWYAFEWLSETAFAWLYGLAGWKGITLLAGALIALYLTVLLKYAVWKGANGLAAVMVTLMTATATAIHYHARPHLFTLLLLACAVWLLDYNRRHGGRLIWLLVPLTALWANLHGGFFIFLVLLALRTAACA
ncbi:MAG TPA: hypothetical protein VMZ52_06125, partial [Bryobacteraceae bacterium]|nr:hypothetical protein [Bryobacteraceae bacterium]